MSYFDFFSKLSEDSQGKTDVIVGKCYSMCPDEEVQLRCRESLVHQLEECSRGGKLVKSFYRSAADTNIAKPHLLRPYAVLKQTVQYLLFEVTKRDEVSTSTMYDFVNDRLRAVRQDATIQRLPPEQCMVLLEPMVRFYVYFGYKLSDYPIRAYDPVLNKKYLLECLKWFLTSADEVDRRGGVERLRVLSAPLLAASYAAAAALRRGHWARARGGAARGGAARGGAARLPALPALALRLHLPHMQKRALHVLSVAYSGSRVPSAWVRRQLQFASDRQVADCCAHYGLAVHGDMIHFNKTHFKADAPLFHIKHLGSDATEKKFEELLANESDELLPT